MAESVLRTRSKDFAKDIVFLCRRLKQNGVEGALLNQLLRCGTSVGANIHEANYAASRADFVNKLQIALKECYETEYWISIFRDTEMISDCEYDMLYSKCSKIRILLISSINTAKDNQK